MPYQAVIGADEAAGDEVALRLRDGRRLPALPAAEVLHRIGGLIGDHRIELWEVTERGQQAQPHPEFHPGFHPGSG